MIEIAPIRLEEKVERLDMSNAFVRSYDQTVIEYESISQRIGVTEPYESQA